MPNVPDIIASIFKADGDGFKASDREVLFLLIERIDNHISTDKERHKKHEERCDEISKNANFAHERISKIKSESTWTKGVWKGATFITTAVLAVVAIAVSIWTAIRTH